MDWYLYPRRILKNKSIKHLMSLGLAIEMYQNSPRLLMDLKLIITSVEMLLVYN